MMVQNPRITEVGKCSGVIKSTLGLILTLSPTAEHGVPHPAVHKARQGLSTSFPKEPMLAEAALAHLNLSF